MNMKELKTPILPIDEDLEKIIDQKIQSRGGIAKMNCEECGCQHTEKSCPECGYPESQVI